MEGKEPAALRKEVIMEKDAKKESVDNDVRKSILIELLHPILKSNKLDAYDKNILIYMVSRFAVITKQGKPWQFSISDISERTAMDRNAVARRLVRFEEQGIAVMIGNQKVGKHIQKRFALKPSALMEALQGPDAIDNCDQSKHAAGSCAKCGGEHATGDCAKCSFEPNHATGECAPRNCEMREHATGKCVNTPLAVALDIRSNLIEDTIEDIIGIPELQPSTLPNASANGNASACSKEVMSTGEAVTVSDASEESIEVIHSQNAVPANLDDSVNAIRNYESGSVNFGGDMSTALGAYVVNHHSRKANKQNDAYASTCAVPAKAKVKQKNGNANMDKATMDSSGMDSSENQSIFPEHLTDVLAGCIRILEMDNYLTEELRQKVIERVVGYIKDNPPIGGNGNAAEDLMDVGDVRNKFDVLHQKARQKAMAQN